MKHPRNAAATVFLLCALLALSPVDARAIEAGAGVGEQAVDDQTMTVDPSDEPVATGDATGATTPTEGAGVEAPANGEESTMPVEEEEAPAAGGESQAQDGEGTMDVQEGDPQAPSDAEGSMDVLEEGDSQDGTESQDGANAEEGQADAADAEEDATLDTQADVTDNPAAQSSQDDQAALDEETAASPASSGEARPTLQAEASSTASGSMTVKAYVQGSGWATGKKDSNSIVTVGSSANGLRIEALRLSLKGTQGGVEYRAHVQGVGWQGWRVDGKTAGSANTGKRMEALRIRLTGTAKSSYDLYYRAYVRNKGWMAWAKNGALSGTTGYALSIDALQVKLVSKGDDAPTGGGRKAYTDPGFSAEAHVQGSGWQNRRTGYRFTLGTKGQGLQMEALKIDRPSSDVSGSVVYRAYVQDSGWLTQCKNGEIAGTTGQGKRIEALRVRLTGNLRERYDVWYRVYVRGKGWMKWTKNGKDAGTEGFGLAVESVQLAFLKKGSSAPSKKGQAVNAAHVSNSATMLWYKTNAGGAWQGYVSKGATSGTTGQAKAVKAMAAQISGVPGTVSYKLHVSNKGWIPSESNGTRAGDGANTVEAFRVSIKGDAAKFYDVWYRAYVQKGGWLDWTKNGKTAGSTGLSLRLEAMQIVLVPKGGAAPGATTHPTYNYVVKKGKAGWQNPSSYPQVSSNTVKLPSYCKGYHTYVTPSRISIWATRDECVEAFIARAYEYLGTTYREPWSQAPGVGVDCSGLVLQCLYATGMDLEHAAGTSKVGGYNPYNHFNVPAQTYNSMRWYENNTFMPVSLSSIRRGDLIFYTGHVAIYLGDGQIIHSTSAFGAKVMISSLYVWSPIGAQRPFV